MKNSRVALKERIKVYIEENPTFTTSAIVQDLGKEKIGRVHISPNRIVNYIRATNLANFDKLSKEWKLKQE